MILKMMFIRIPYGKGRFFGKIYFGEISQNTYWNIRVDNNSTIKKIKNKNLLLKNQMSQKVACGIAASISVKSWLNPLDIKYFYFGYLIKSHELKCTFFMTS